MAMRSLASALVVSLVISSLPLDASAQLARGAAAPTAARIVVPGVSVVSFVSVSPLSAVSTLPLSVSAAFTPALIVPKSMPALPTARPTPAIALAPVARASALAAAPRNEPLPAKIERLSVAAAQDSQDLPQAPGAAQAHGTAERGFERLLGREISGRAQGAVTADAVVPVSGIRRTTLARLSARPNAVTDPAPPAHPAPARNDTRWYIGGSALFKIGMESLGLAVPLIALIVFGQAKWAAGMAMGWGLAQIIGSSVGGGLLDRRPPAKVLAWTMGLQALSVTILLGLFVAQSALGIPLAQPAAVLALHMVTGVLAGVADTARQVIPPVLVGDEGQALKVFNSKVHVAYEFAGVVGAILAGLLIKNFGVVFVLALHPPTYLLAAWAFSRLRLAPAINAQAAGAPSHRGIRQTLGRAWSDLMAGAKTIRATPVIFWASVALVIPLVLHRLLEGLLIPIAAKTLLADPSVAAWMMGASNFGELVGAFLLMRANLSNAAAAKLRSPFWVRLMSMGLVGLWAFTFSPTLWAILPWIAFGSLSWAASDLSLRSKLQEILAPEMRGRTFGFLTAAAFAIVFLSSMGLGFIFDAFPAAPVFLGINAVLLVLVGGLFYAAHKLAATYKAKP